MIPYLWHTNYSAKAYEKEKWISDMDFKIAMKIVQDGKFYQRTGS